MLTTFIKILVVLSMLESVKPCAEQMIATADLDSASLTVRFSVPLETCKVNTFQLVVASIGVFETYQLTSKHEITQLDGRVHYQSRIPINQTCQDYGIRIKPIRDDGVSLGTVLLTALSSTVNRIVVAASMNPSKIALSYSLPAQPCQVKESIINVWTKRSTKSVYATQENKVAQAEGRDYYVLDIPVVDVCLDNIITVSPKLSNLHVLTGSDILIKSLMEPSNVMAQYLDHQVTVTFDAYRGVCGVHKYKIELWDPTGKLNETLLPPAQIFDVSHFPTSNQSAKSMYTAYFTSALNLGRLSVAVTSLDQNFNPIRKGRKESKIIDLGGEHATYGIPRK